MVITLITCNYYLRQVQFYDNYNYWGEQEHHELEPDLGHQRQPVFYHHGVEAADPETWVLYTALIRYLTPQWSWIDVSPGSVPKKNYIKLNKNGEHVCARYNSAVLGLQMKKIIVEQTDLDSCRLYDRCMSYGCEPVQLCQILGQQDSNKLLEAEAAYLENYDGALPMQYYNYLDDMHQLANKIVHNILVFVNFNLLCLFVILTCSAALFTFLKNKI